MKIPYAGEMSQADDFFRDRVRERDLDNFLVEELFASPAFLTWMVSRAGDSFSAPMSQHVLLQKSPPRERDRRQTDVRIGWFDDDQTLRACVLIESKVTADFQAGQAQAYAAELAALRERLGRKAASALLVAPAARMTLRELIEALELADVAGAGDAPVRVVLRKADTNEGLQYELIGVQGTEGWDSPIVLIYAGGHAATMDWPVSI
ncbi:MULTISPECIES: hypothetical protein [unclassified Mesorhizobium]|uniref:hypothetical protein n=1 Tax=unclassified Mesorhizobium TaxID=325217 RepID=UPI0033364272